MPKAAVSSGGGSSSQRTLRPLPGRQIAARVPVNLADVIVLTDSESDESSDGVEIIERPPKRRRTRVDTLDALAGDFGRLLPKEEPGVSVTATANGNAHPAQSQSGSKSESESEPTASISAPATAAPEEDVDPIDRFLAQVLEIVPDVDPSHARALLMQHLDKQGGNAVEIVLHNLLESPYPKIDRKGKGKRKRLADGDAGHSDNNNNNGNDDDGHSNEDYTKTDRPKPKGRYYRIMTFSQLCHDFPDCETKEISKVLKANKNLYAPTFFALSLSTNATNANAQSPSSSRSSDTMTMKAPVAMQFGKGKMQDPDFEIEFAWVVRKVQKDAQSASTGSSSRGEAEEYDDGEVDDQSGTPCGCCFSVFNPENMISCPADHLFCGSCIRQYVATKLGELDPYIKCMDQSGCKLPFTESDLKRPLSSKLVDLYDRVKMTKDIEAAGLEGLEECPFCEYKVIIENADEKLVHCQREDCGATSCRKCKKPEHLPKSCEEAENDKGLNARHKVEEAMTSALMRNCPQCKKSFVKEYGCNKMTCPNCKAHSCYVCRQLIKGYDHFYDSAGRGRGGPSTSSQGKCSLWEETEALHLKEVTAARERVIKEMVADPTIDRSQLNVELPKAGPARQPLVAARVPPAVVRRRVLEEMMIGAAPGHLGLAELVQPPAARVPQQQVHHHYHHQMGPLQVDVGVRPALAAQLQPGPCAQCGQIHAHQHRQQQQQQQQQPPLHDQPRVPPPYWPAAAPLPPEAMNEVQMYLQRVQQNIREQLQRTRAMHDERQAEIRRHVEENMQRQQRLIEEQRRQIQEANAAVAQRVAQQQEQVRQQWILEQRVAPAINAAAPAPAPPAAQFNVGAAFQQPHPAGQIPPFPLNFGQMYGMNAWDPFAHLMGHVAVPQFPFGPMAMANVQPNQGVFNNIGNNAPDQAPPGHVNLN